MPDAPLVGLVFELAGAEAEPEPELDGEAGLVVAFVPLSVMARSWNAVKLRAEVCTGFTAKTMPSPQCEEPSAACCLHCMRDVGQFGLRPDARIKGDVHRTRAGRWCSP